MELFISLTDLTYLKKNYVFKNLIQIILHISAII